jgi:hypothetical protein
MARKIVLLVGCVGSFIVGWSCNALVGHAAMPITAGGHEESSLVREVTERLSRIEAMLDRVTARPDAASATGEQPPTREPIRASGINDLTQLVEKLKGILADRQTARSGFGELLHAHALPNETALNKLRDDFAKDKSPPEQTILGMDCHDLICDFGAPTKRRLVGYGSQGVTSEWIWKLPSSDSCFSVSLVNNVPTHCFFFPRTYLDKR